MSEVAVSVKTPHGLWMPCRATAQPDGAFWQCGYCNQMCCRVSFGIMNGFWRCRCGCELDVTVDGQPIELKQFETAEVGLFSQPATPRMTTPDDQFLKNCGIVADYEPQGGG